MTWKAKGILWACLIVIVVSVVVGLVLFLNQKVDMSGGYYIAYQIDTRGLEPGEANDRIRETIEVLRRRVDPKHVLRLGWIPWGRDRFEVQIPLPRKSVKRKYEAYRKAEAELATQGISSGTALRYYIEDDVPEAVEKDPSKRDAVRQYHLALDRYMPYLGIYDPVRNRFDPDSIKRKITQTGYLDFRILPTLEHSDLSESEIERYVERLQAQGPRAASDANLVWCEIGNQSQWHENRACVAPYEGKYYVLASNAPDECMLHGPKANWRIDRVSKSADRMGRPAVSFTLDERGGALLGTLTGNHIDRPLCILLDNIALTAPVINDRVSKDVMITGSFTSMDIQRTMDYLNAGCLSVTIMETPIAEGFIDNGDETKKNTNHGKPANWISAMIILKEDVRLTRLNVRDRIRQTGQERAIATLAAATARGLGGPSGQMPDGDDFYHEYEITTAQEDKAIPPAAVEAITSAILATFEEELDLPPDLDVTVVSAEKVTAALADRDPELSDFLGGISIRCALGEGSTGRELIDRFENLKFRPDLAESYSYSYKILGVDLNPLGPDGPVNAFVYVSGGSPSLRELGEEAWALFKKKEMQKIVIATRRGSLPRVTQFETSSPK